MTLTRFPDKHPSPLILRLRSSDTRVSLLWPENSGYADILIIRRGSTSFRLSMFNSSVWKKEKEREGKNYLAEQEGSEKNNIILDTWPEFERSDDTYLE